MKCRLQILSLTFLLSLNLLAAAQTPAKPQAVYVGTTDKPSLRYEDALQFRIINRGFPYAKTNEAENQSAQYTESAYTRLPVYLKDSVRENLWWLAGCSTGIGIRFATDSRTIAARYNLKRNFYMAHMAMTGIKGTDLYRLGEDNKWHYVNTCRPTKDSVQHKVYVENMDGMMHEYLIYLPLYDGNNWFEIGVDSTARLEQPHVDNPRRNKGKIVCYGTSVMQGGCATRTGMTQTTMLQRDLNIEVVNLGFSGEGKMDYCIARAMASIPDVVCYVIDPVPNCTKDMCDTLTYGFIRILRDAHPDVPIIMVEGLTYPYAKYDSYFRDYLPAKNAAFRRNYEQLKKENHKNLYYMTTDGMTGLDEEGTVDGIHLTDIGFRAYTDKLEKILRKVMKKQLK
ncbi:MAG: SGNH/GDSL hydrolase family protein [Paludibacteraceae bacterium]|nr:SGNH/GDSL hydrolase family protein [Paludibacteraceae bacterium]